MYKSQWKQDQWVNENFFHNKRNGVFVDIGAHDGVVINNTYFFEKELGWTGICVEPIPKVYEQLRKNRKAECINGCAYNRSGTITFHQVDGYAEMLSGIEETYNDKHRNRIAHEISSQGGTCTIIESKCYTLKELLEERNITHVDYLSIDTEGSELQVLEGIDFNKVTFGIIEIEVNYPEEDEEMFNKFLLARGYKFLIKLGGDNLYCRV